MIDDGNKDHISLWKYSCLHTRFLSLLPLTKSAVAASHFFLQSPCSLSALLQLSLNSSGIHTEKSILLWPLCLWKRTETYINIHMWLFQLLSFGTEPVNELFFCLIMKPVYMGLYGRFVSFPMHPSLHRCFHTTYFLT